GIRAMARGNGAAPGEWRGDGDLKPLLGLLVATMLTACADGRSNVRYVDMTDPSRATPPVPPKGPAATIVVRREPGIGLWSANSVFLMDGMKVVALHAGEQYRFVAAPGRHTVSAKCENPGLVEFHNEKTFESVAAGTYVFRLATSTTDYCLIVPVV